MKKQNNKNHELHIWNVKLTTESRKALKKIKDDVHGNVANGIEYGNWLISFKNYEYRDIKEHLEKRVFRKFFNIPKDTLIKIESFNTGILTFEKGH